jgi:hypothetical protein
MKTVKHEELVYEKKWQFLEFDHKHAVTLRPDNYEYEFDVALPGGKQAFPFRPCIRAAALTGHCCVTQICPSRSKDWRMRTYFIG